VIDTNASPETIRLAHMAAQSHQRSETMNAPKYRRRGAPKGTLGTDCRSNA
jgi:hypothetical protein